MSLLNIQIDSGIGHVELNRVEARNAINLEMIRELTALLGDWAARDDLKVVILSGAGGKAFASGADIAELRERTHREAFFGVNATLFQKLEDFPRPTIAAIEGYALGGGLELALSCDLRVASESAKLGLPETGLGIYPAAGGTWRLPKLVGLGRAKDLVFTGRILDAAEAYRIGLADRTCPAGDALKVARELARQIAENGQLALQVAKVALNGASRGGEPATLERLGQALLFDSADKRERMTAFLEKRSKKK